MICQRSKSYKLSGQNFASPMSFMYVDFFFHSTRIYMEELFLAFCTRQRTIVLKRNLAVFFNREAMGKVFMKRSSQYYSCFPEPSLELFDDLILQAKG